MMSLVSSGFFDVNFDVTLNKEYLEIEAHEIIHNSV
jgi:hypothetical protein